MNEETAETPVATDAKSQGQMLADLGKKAEA